MAHAQQSRIIKIGMLWHGGNAEEEKEFLNALTGALRDLGYIDGKNAQFLHRFPAERPDRFRELARELVSNKVDVIIVQTQTGAMELKQATTTIPVIFVSIGDPVG